MNITLSRQMKEANSLVWIVDDDLNRVLGMLEFLLS